ncbi:MAG: hypothetical protein V1690_02145 [Candidatus Moraniibacteriota bacterium]
MNIEEKVQSLSRLRNKIYKTEDFDALREVHDKIAIFAKRLQAKHGKDICTDYAFYHILVGSTPRIPWKNFPVEKIDFQGKDSVENFLKELAEEYTP